MSFISAVKSIGQKVLPKISKAGAVAGLKNVAKAAFKGGAIGLALGGIGFAGYKAYEAYKAKGNEIEASKQTKQKTKPKAKKPEPKMYTVQKGDCVWNIAKKDLQEAHKNDKNYKVKNAEIAKRTKEIMDLNNLKYEKDGKRVLIHPKDKLKLSA